MFLVSEFLQFDIKRIHRSVALVNSEKLNWHNRKHIILASKSRLDQLADELYSLIQNEYPHYSPDSLDLKYLESVILLMMVFPWVILNLLIHKGSIVHVERHPKALWLLFQGSYIR